MDEFKEFETLYSKLAAAYSLLPLPPVEALRRKAEDINVLCGVVANGLLYNALKDRANRLGDLADYFERRTS